MIFPEKVKPKLAPAPEFAVTPLEPLTLKDGILVRTPNWLGDAVMTLPALMQLKKIIPKYCGLFVICPPGLSDLFQSLPFITVVYPLEQAHKNWSKKELRVFTKLHAGAGILFNNSLRDVLCLRLCGIKPLYGAAARGRGFLLKRSFKFPPRVSNELNNLHHTNKYLSIVKALGAPDWDGTLPEFKIKTPISAMDPAVADFCRHPKLMTIAAGAAYGGSKRWAADNFRAVADYWLQQGGSVAVVGSGKEADIAAEAIAGLPPEKVCNTAGKTDMSGLMHLLKNSAVTVANDSGVMHLSAVLGRPGVAVFGPTDYSATGPISDRWKIIYQKQPCSPCFKRECPNGSNICMQQITPKMVIDELSKIDPRG